MRLKSRSLVFDECFTFSACRALGLIFYIFLQKRCFPTARPPPSLGVHVGSMCSSSGTRWRPLAAPWVSLAALWPPFGRPLAAPGRPWPPLAPPGCPWLALAAPGRPWPPLLGSGLESSHVELDSMTRFIMYFFSFDLRCGLRHFLSE